MNIAKLLAKGRLVPIEKTNGEGKRLLVGYERKATSRKAGQQFWLKEPKEIKP